MPIHFVCATCGASYTLKDELAGKKVRCKECESVLLVPEAPPAPVEALPVDRGYAPAFARDRFFVNQKRISIGEKYYVFDEDQQPILFVERPAHLLRQLGAALGAVGMFFLGLVITAVLVGLASSLGGDVLMVIAAIMGGIATLVATVVVAVWISPKRHITVYTDDSKQEPLLRVYQDRKFNIIRATYTVECPLQGRMGHLMKNYLYNIFRKRWYVVDSDGSVQFLAKEDSLILSLLRRLLGPLFGLLRTNYVVLEPATERVLGEFNRKFTLFDRYVLDMTSDRTHALDRRMALALAVMLDTGERR